VIDPAIISKGSEVKQLAGPPGAQFKEYLEVREVLDVDQQSQVSFNIGADIKCQGFSGIESPVINPRIPACV